MNDVRERATNLPWSRVLLLASFVSLLAGCSITRAPENVPISHIDENSGYRRIDLERLENLGDTVILLSFSGGGTRAAALSYGVLEELRDTLLERDGKRVRLLDEVDAISSVSGGSFTAAYYGVYRDRIFEDYEDEFLRQGIQKALIMQLLNPAHWIRSAFSGFDRTEMAADYYDRKIFKGATFGDIERQGPPFIDINATDLTTGLRFTFGQERFDLLCADLASYPVARAVTASSAVPVLFPTVVLKNYADQCDIEATREWELLEYADRNAETIAQRELVDGLMSYRDVERREFIHLVDGGIADNLGLRVMIDRFESYSEVGFEFLRRNPPRNFVLIMVNAEVKPETYIEKHAKKPSAATTMNAYTSAQMNRYNQETLDRLKSNIAQLQSRLQAEEIRTRIYFARVDFDQIKAREVSTVLNSLPTSLELEDIQVDRLIAAGRFLLRSDPEFERFKQDNDVKMSETAIAYDELCRRFGYQECAGFQTKTAADRYQKAPSDGAGEAFE